MILLVTISLCSATLISITNSVDARKHPSDTTIGSTGTGVASIKLDARVTLGFGCGPQCFDYRAMEFRLSTYDSFGGLTDSRAIKGNDSPFLLVVNTEATEDKPDKYSLRFVNPLVIPIDKSAHWETKIDESNYKDLLCEGKIWRGTTVKCTIPISYDYRPGPAPY